MADIYVSSLGDDAAAGTYEAPYLTLKYAHDNASANDHIWLADAGGVFAEDWGSGYILWSTDSVKLSSYFPDDPCTIQGLSGAFSVRLGGSLTDVEFSNLNIATGAAANTSLLMVSTGTASSGISCRGVNFLVKHDIASSSYVVNASGGGAHTGWEFQDCTIDSLGRNCNGIYATQSDWEVINTTIKTALDGSGYGIRQGASCDNLTVSGCDVTAPNCFLQNTAAAETITRVVNTNFTGVGSVLTVSGTTVGDVRLQIDGCNGSATGTGFMVAGNNVKFTVSNTVCTAGNPTFGFPTDGAYSDVSGTIYNCSGNGKSSTSTHVMLVGVGGVGVSIIDSNFSADLAGYSLVLKGTGHILKGNTFSGGRTQGCYFKGAENSQFFENTVMYADEGSGAAIAFAQDADLTVPSGLRIMDNVITVTDGALFGIAAADDDGTNVVDYNVYNVAGTGTWGTVEDTACASLADVRAAWTLTTNDDNSAENRLSTAAPTAAAVADAVWDELLTGHVIASSAGAALSAAGTAGDPWITALPGSYTAGQAGYILPNISASSVVYMGNPSERITGTDITTYKGETYAASVEARDVNGNIIDLSANTMYVVIEDQETGTDLLVIADGSLTKSATSIDFTITTAVTNILQPSCSWALRDTTTDEVYLKGTIYVEPVATQD